jgi:hypothetical protein
MPDFKVPGTQNQVKKPASQPPAPSESFGGPLPEDSVYDKDANTEQDVLAERNRLNRIGVKSDDIGEVRRGVNIVAEGHQGDITGQVVLQPRPVPSQSEFPSKYKINEYGDSIPAKSLGGVVTTPHAQNPPAPQPPTPMADSKPLEQKN